MKRVMVFLSLLLVIAAGVLVCALLSISGSKDSEPPPTLFVAPEPSPSAAGTPSPAPPKVIYLTFDDGPYENTERLLGILDKYGVKATFFVTCDYEDYTWLIGEEHKRGHAVGIHAYKHKYAKIYQNEASFIESIEKMQEVVREQTGEEVFLYRFPGGSSNQVSNGMMPELVELVAENSLIYFDWDVDGHDATDAKDKETVLNYLKSGLEDCKEYSVVLCHDLYPYTVDAMEDFIPWALENGFVFDKLSADAPEVHHRLAEVEQ